MGPRSEAEVSAIQVVAPIAASYDRSMSVLHSRDRILANRSKPAGSFWTLSKLSARLLLGPMGEPTEEQYQAFVDAMFEGDPLADAVAAWMLENGVGRSMKLFDQAVKQGIGSLAEPPEALRAFFAEVDRKPAWVDEDMLLLGQRAVQRTGYLMPYILGDITLVGGYLTMSAMNKSLVATGALAPGSSAKRLHETLCWWLDVTGDRGLERFAPGFASTIKVRVMHSIVRLRLSKDPKWRYEEWGAPLSQAHLATTNQAFGVAYVTLARALGVRYSREEREAIMHLWRYAGFLMGVADAYNCSTEREGFRLIRLSTETSPAPDEDAARLAEGYFEAELDFRRLLPERPLAQALGGLATRLTTRTRVGTLRFLLGPGDSRALRLPSAGPFVLFPIALAGTTFASQAVLSLVPGSRRLEALLGRRIHLGIRDLAPASTDARFTPYEHREGGERLAMRGAA